MIASPNDNSDFQKLSFPFLSWSTYFLDIDSLSINTGSFPYKRDQTKGGLYVS